MAEAFQADMKAAGIGLEIKVLEQSAYYDALWDTREFDLLMYRTYTDAQLPYRFMTSLFYQTDSNNGIATSNPKFAELLDKIGLTADLKGQQSLFDDVFKLLYDEAVAVPVYYTSEVFATSKRIKNFTFDVIEDSPVKWHLLEIGE